MYIVDKKTKKSTKVIESTFAALKMSERNDLQEWIVNEPRILGEELLIIQKEFSGFSDTNERLDLLAIDKQGNLVIIENKLDDSGKDVTWQAMKYASYCSTLSKDNIRVIFQEYLKVYETNARAEDKICDFLQKSDFEEVQLNRDLSQRIILVAREFRKEVTSTVLWARKFRIQVQCIKFTPYMMGDILLLDTEQIIPVKDVAEIMINYENKALDEAETSETIAEREIIRDKFWKELLPKMNAKSDMYKGINTEGYHYDHWLSTGSGISGVVFSFVITKKYASVELGIAKNEQEENKKLFDTLLYKKDAIEADLGYKLSWQRLDDKKMSRIAYILDGVNIFNSDDWPKIQEFLIENMIRFDKVIRKILDKTR